MIGDRSRNVKIITDGRIIRYICPKCKNSIQFKKKIHGNSICMRCGQHLDWSPVHDICSETIYTQDTDEVAWIAMQYYASCGMSEDDWIQIDELRHTLRGEGAELYLLFLNKKSHGSFMRKYAKEGIIHDG